MPNLFKAYVEGLGSKRLAAVVAGIAAVFVALALQRWAGFTVDAGAIAAMVGPVVLYVLTQWNLDKATGGQTTTAYRLTLATATAVEKLAKDGNLIDTIARQVIKALQDAEPPGAAPNAPVAPAAAVVPPTPPAQP